ncbi:MAG: hypothetical protein M3256_24745 [Actinomycetota bacterium]|nr:hypothetical protein [Actinomycetota bacterium]
MEGEPSAVILDFRQPTPTDSVPSDVDYLPDGEPLPEHARDMLTQALDSLDASHSPPPEEIVGLIAADLVATLGWTNEQASGVAATVGRVHDPDTELLAMEATEEVQVWLHDSFLDTSWPRCPQHPNHPLWLGEDQPFMWRCPRTGDDVAALGSLGTVVPAPTAEQAASAQVHLAEEQRWVRAMLEQVVPRLRRRLGR